MCLTGDRRQDGILPMNPESDAAFLQRLIDRLPRQSMGPSITLSKGTIHLTNDEQSRLFKIAENRGQHAKALLEELLK